MPPATPPPSPSPSPSAPPPLAPCSGVVALGACWMLGELGEPCTDVCGEGGTPLDSAFTLSSGSTSEVVDAVSRRYGLHQYLTTDSLGRNCRHPDDPEHPAAFVYFPESHAWDCLPGEGIARLARVYRSSCACTRIFPPPAPSPSPPFSPPAPLVFGQPIGFVGGLALALILCFGLACCAICAASMSRPGGGTKLLLSLIGPDPPWARELSLLSGEYGGRIPRRLHGPSAGLGGFEHELLPWRLWCYNMCYCCCCWPGLMRCWRTWQAEGLREEIRERQDEIQSRSARDAWRLEMSRRYGGGYGGGGGGGERGYPNSPRLLESYDVTAGGRLLHCNGSSAGGEYGEAHFQRRLGYDGGAMNERGGGYNGGGYDYGGGYTCGGRTPIPPRSASAVAGIGRTPAYFPSTTYSERDLGRDLGDPTPSPRAVPASSFTPPETQGLGGATPGGLPVPGYAGCGATPSGFAALASQRTQQRGVLSVHIKSGANLMPGDLNFRSDPYVVVRCPGREGREEQRTRHVPKTLDPVWNETLTFTSCTLDELLRHGIHLRVMDKDWVTKDDSLGEMTVMLDALRVQNYHEYSELLPDKGSLMFSVQWEPERSGRHAGSTMHAAGGAEGGAAGTLHVFLDRGVNLKPADRNGFSDPYVKLTCHGVTHTSKTIKKSLDPQWRQSFQWFLPLSSLAARPDALQLECWDKDTLSRDDSLGHGAADLRGLLPNETRDVAVPLSAQGTLHLRVQWVRDGGSGAPFAQPSRGGGGDACLPAAPTLPPPAMAAPMASIRDDTSVSTFGTTVRSPPPPGRHSHLRPGSTPGAAGGAGGADARSFAASRLGWQPPAGSYGAVMPPLTRPTAPSTTRTAPGSAKRSPATAYSPRCSELL